MTKLKKEILRREHWCDFTQASHDLNPIERFNYQEHEKQFEKELVFGASVALALFFLGLVFVG